MAFGKQRYKKSLPVKKPFSQSKSYVDLKDAQADTEGGRLKAPTTTATQRVGGTYPTSSMSPSYVSQKATADIQASSRSKPATGDKWDGWAGRYVPGQRDMLFSNPDIIVRDWLSQGKYKNNPQMAGDLSRYADIYLGSGNQPGLFELLMGGSTNAKGTGDDDMINAMVEFLGEQSKVGGRSPSVQGMLNMLYEMFDNPTSVLNERLADANGSDPGDAAGTSRAIAEIMAFIPLLGEFTGNQRYAQALTSAANRIAQQYQDLAVKGKNTMSFQDYLRDNYLR